MAANPVNIPALAPSLPITSDGVAASAQFAAYWRNVISAIQSALNGVVTTQAAQAAQLATTTRIIQSLSFTEALTISAAAGTSAATISISAHERIYLDIPAVAVGAGTIQNVPFGTNVLIYYDDPDRKGGPVTYGFTTDPNQAATSNANPGRVFVGSVTTPASASSPPTTGAPPVAPTQSGKYAQQ